MRPEVLKYLFHCYLKEKKNPLYYYLIEVPVFKLPDNTLQDLGPVFTFRDNTLEDAPGYHENCIKMPLHGFEEEKKIGIKRVQIDFENQEVTVQLEDFIVADKRVPVEHFKRLQMEQWDVFKLNKMVKCSISKMAKMVQFNFKKSELMVQLRDSKLYKEVQEDFEKIAQSIHPVYFEVMQSIKQEVKQRVISGFQNLDKKVKLAYWELIRKVKNESLHFNIMVKRKSWSSDEMVKRKSWSSDEMAKMESLNLDRMILTSYEELENWIKCQCANLRCEVEFDYYKLMCQARLIDPEWKNVSANLKQKTKRINWEINGYLEEVASAWRCQDVQKRLSSTQSEEKEEVAKSKKSKETRATAEAEESGPSNLDCKGKTVEFEKKSDAAKDIPSIDDTLNLTQRMTARKIAHLMKSKYDNLGELQTSKRNVPVKNGSMVEFENRCLFASPNDDHVTISIVRIGNADNMFTVKYQTENITATEGIHYKGSREELTFLEKEMGKLIEIMLLQVPENNARFKVKLVDANIQIGYNNPVNIIITNLDELSDEEKRRIRNIIESEKFSFTNVISNLVNPITLAAYTIALMYVCSNANSILLEFAFAFELANIRSLNIPLEQLMNILCNYFQTAPDLDQLHEEIENQALRDSDSGVPESSDFDSGVPEPMGFDSGVPEPMGFDSGVPEPMDFDSEVPESRTQDSEAPESRN